MYTYDRKRAEQVIAEESGGKLVATKDYHSTNYVFTSWKHALYDEDDDRGKFTGGGPLVFYRNTGEYRFCGTGDLIQGTFGAEMDEAYGPVDDAVKELPTKEDIIAGIHRRGYVNFDDADLLLKYLEADFPDIGCVFIGKLGGLDNFIYESPNPEYVKAVAALWDSFGFRYHWADDVLLLHREKK